MSAIQKTYELGCNGLYVFKISIQGALAAMREQELYQSEDVETHFVAVLLVGDESAVERAEKVNGKTLEKVDVVVSFGVLLAGGLVDDACVGRQLQGFEGLTVQVQTDHQIDE